MEPLIGSLNRIGVPAVEALVKIGDKRAIEPIIEYMKYTSDPDLVISALNKLSATKEQIERAKEIWKKEKQAKSKALEGCEYDTEAEAMDAIRLIGVENSFTVKAVSYHTTGWDDGGGSYVFEPGVVPDWFVRGQIDDVESIKYKIVRKSPITIRGGTLEGRHDLATAEVKDGALRNYQGVDNTMQDIMAGLVQKVITLEGESDEIKAKIETLLGNKTQRKELLNNKTIRIVQDNDRLMHFSEAPDMITLDIDALKHTELLFMEFIHELLHANRAVSSRAPPTAEQRTQEEAEITAQEVELFLLFTQDAQTRILEALKADNDLDDQKFYKVLEAYVRLRPYYDSIFEKTKESGLEDAARFTGVQASIYDTSVTFGFPMQIADSAAIADIQKTLRETIPNEGVLYIQPKELLHSTMEVIGGVGITTPPDEATISERIRRVSGVLGEIDPFEVDFTGVNITSRGDIILQGYAKDDAVDNLRAKLRGVFGIKQYYPVDIIHVSIGRILKPLDKATFAKLMRTIESMRFTHIGTEKVNALKFSYHRDNLGEDKDELVVQYLVNRKLLDDAAKTFNLDEGNKEYFRQMWIKYLKRIQGAPGSQALTIITDPGMLTRADYNPENDPNFILDAMAQDILAGKNLSPEDVQKLIGTVQYLDLVTDANNKDKAKSVVVTVNGLDGGIGENVGRLKFLKQVATLRGKNPENVKLGAKGTDLGFIIKDYMGQPEVFISIAEAKIMQLVLAANAGKFAKIQFQPVVNYESKISYDELLDQVCIEDRFDTAKERAEPKKTYKELKPGTQRTYRQLMEESEIEVLPMMDAPDFPGIKQLTKTTGDVYTDKDEDEEITKQYVQHGGHGNCGFLLLLKTLRDELPADGKTHIRVFVNGDNVNSRINEHIAGAMAKEGWPIVKLTTKATLIDTKGGKDGLRVVKRADGTFLYVPDQMEVADARTADNKNPGQLTAFYKSGQDPAKPTQPFNTNIFYINTSVLHGILKDLEAVIGRERLYEIISPSLINKILKKIEKGLHAGDSFMALEGAIGTAMHNLNSYFMESADLRVQNILKERGLDRVLFFVDVPRTEFFTPVKKTFDLWFLSHGKYFGALNAVEPWSLYDSEAVKVNKKEPPEFDIAPAGKKDYWDDVQVFIDALGKDADVTELVSLKIRGKVTLPDAKLIGNVVIINKSNEVVDLKDQQKYPDFFIDDKLVLGNKIIIIDEKGVLGWKSSEKFETFTDSSGADWSMWEYGGKDGADLDGLIRRDGSSEFARRQGTYPSGKFDIVSLEAIVPIKPVPSAWRSRDIVTANVDGRDVDFRLLFQKTGFWLADRADKTGGTILITQTRTPPPSLTHNDYNYGEMIFKLTVFDSTRHIAVYGEYRFREDLETERIAKEGIVPLRNIGYSGIKTVFEHKSSATLNSPENGYPVTSMTTNYQWAKDAYFPGIKVQYKYGPYVFAILPGDKIGVIPTIRTGDPSEPYFSGKDMGEYHTEDPISYDHALLLTSKDEYERIRAAKPKSREGALILLGRRMEDQAEYENRVYEESLGNLGLPVNPEDISGVEINPLYKLLVGYRARSQIEEGMLFHLRAPPGAKVMLTGEFNNWADSEASGAMKLEEIEKGIYAIVVPKNRIKQGTYKFKFIVEKDGKREYENGLYGNADDIYKNSIITISGNETYFSKERASARLKAIQDKSGILYVATEAEPFIKIGGLGDFMGELPGVMSQHKNSITVVIPRYKSMDDASLSIEDTGIAFNVPIGNKTERIVLQRARSNGVTIYLIESEHYFKNPYEDTDSIYGLREAVLLSRASLEIAVRLGIGIDVIHCNDWQTALVPAYIKTLYREALPNVYTVLGLHNLGYQGLYPMAWFLQTGIPMTEIDSGRPVWARKLGLLKYGLVTADKIHVPSITYAAEIITPEQGMGLEHILRERAADIIGILDGIDLKKWNPETDSAIYERYNSTSSEKKSINKVKLQEAYGLKIDPEAPLIGIISRLFAQKGLELVIREAEDILNTTNAQIIVLGKGEEKYEKAFAELGAKYHGRVIIQKVYNDDLSRKIYAGSDIFLMPSLYEPCGISQQIAMRYGSLPVVRATGGLVDTVTSDRGFMFTEFDSKSMMAALKAAMEVFNNDKPRWKEMMRKAMEADLGWETKESQFESMYNSRGINLFLSPKAPDQDLVLRQTPQPSLIVMRAGVTEGRYDIATAKVVNGTLRDYQGVDNSMKDIMAGLVQKVITLEGESDAVKAKIEALLGNETQRRELLKSKNMRIAQGNDRLMHFSEAPDMITFDIDALKYTELLFMEFIHELLHANRAVSSIGPPTDEQRIQEEKEVTTQEVELFLLFPQDVQDKILEILKTDNDLDDREFYTILEKVRTQGANSITDNIRKYVIGLTAITPSMSADAAREAYLEALAHKTFPEFIIALPNVNEAVDRKNEQIVKKAIEGAPALKGIINIEFVRDVNAFNTRVAAGNVNGIFLDTSMLEMSADTELQNVLNEVTIDASAILVSSRTRVELERILKEIAATLDEIGRFDIDKAVQLRLGIGHRDGLQQKLAGQISALKTALIARKEAVSATYNSMPMADKVALAGKSYALATTEKVAFSNMFTIDNMFKAEAMGVVNCFIYGEMLKTEDEARAFVTASGYEGNIDNIRFVDKRGLSYEEIVSAISARTGVTAQNNIGIACAKDELGAVTAITGEKLLEMKEMDMGGVKVVASINYYQTLLQMVTTPEDLLNKMIADGQLPPGVTYDSVKRIFIYLPKAMPINYGREIETYRNAIRAIRTAA
ncbi:MAG: UTP--glucose-1-phosphate uridylyltransferase [Candidatus Omnitrophica bacterium]|nr:UTP--glucose-1-phosphate uridylyltransferase [Candidatus Omnitrophota bacterium]